MYLEIKHKNNSFHTIQTFPTGNYDMGRSSTYSGHLDHTLMGSKNKTFPYNTSIHQYFGELETQTHP